MAISDYLKTLSPTLKRDEVLEDVRVTLKELDTIVIPAYNTADTFFKTNRLTSPSVKELSDNFYEEFKPKGGRKSTFIGDIAEALAQLRDNIQYVYEDSEKILETDVIAAGLTIKKAFYVRLSEYANFMTNYSIDLLNFCYYFEMQEMVGTSEANHMEVNPMTMKTVMNNMDNYARLMSAYAIKHSDFVKITEKLVDVLATTNDGVLSGIYDKEQYDPTFVALTSGFIPYPVYHFRMMVAEYQLKRYRSNENKKRALELRLLHIKMLKEKKNDPRLEKEISYIQGRIDAFERDMAEVKESLGINDKTYY
jgi:hypothetical protein